MTSPVATRPTIRIAGTADSRLMDALQFLSVTTTSAGMDHCRIDVTDWASSDYRFADIELGQQIEIELDAPAAERVFRGEITGLEIGAGNGAPSLTLLAEDSLHPLARRINNADFSDIELSAVVDQIATDHGLTATVARSVHGNWHQDNVSDLAFIRQLASYLNLRVALVDNQIELSDEEDASSPVPIDGSQVTQLRILADLNKQASSVSSFGKSVNTGGPVSATASAMAPTPTGTSAAEELQRLGWENERYLSSPMPHSDTQADEYAQSAFNAMGGRFVRGEVVCSGDSRFRIGRSIELGQVQPRFAGTYQLTSCIHSYDTQAGYNCMLEIQRGSLQ